MRGHCDEGDSDIEAMWQALCERVYPIRDARGVGDGRRIYHQDVPLLSDVDLELDTLRARFRACLEQDWADRRWLLARIDRIVDEQAKRAEAAWPPVEVEEISVRLTHEPDATAPPPALEPPLARQRRRADDDGYGMSRAALQEAVLRRLAAIERGEAEIVAVRLADVEDAR